MTWDTFWLVFGLVSVVGWFGFLAYVAMVEYPFWIDRTNPSRTRRQT